MKAYIGVDPGSSGSIAVIIGDVVKFIKLKETLHDQAEFLRDITTFCESSFALLEKVNAMPKQGVSSTFKFGASFGMCQGLLAALRVPHEFITPAKWQGAMKCRTGGDKNVSKARAQQLFPRLKITHANADALLLAELCRRQQEGVE